MKAVNMPEGLPEDIDSGEVCARQDFKIRARFVFLVVLGQYFDTVFACS